MTPLNCTLYGGKYAMLQNSHVNQAALISMFLTAYVTNDPNLKIRISEGTSDCKISYAYIEK